MVKVDYPDRSVGTNRTPLKITGVALPFAGRRPGSRPSSPHGVVIALFLA
jgi:hypothetical protein